MIRGILVFFILVTVFQYWLYCRTFTVSQSRLDAIDKKLEIRKEKERAEEAKYQQLLAENDLLVVDEIEDTEMEGTWNVCVHQSPYSYRLYFQCNI